MGDFLHAAPRRIVVLLKVTHGSAGVDVVPQSEDRRLSTRDNRIRRVPPTRRCWGSLARALQRGIRGNAYRRSVATRDLRGCKDEPDHVLLRQVAARLQAHHLFFFKQKTAYEM